MSRGRLLRSAFAQDSAEVLNRGRLARTGDLGNVPKAQQLCGIQRHAVSLGLHCYTPRNAPLAGIPSIGQRKVSTRWARMSRAVLWWTREPREGLQETCTENPLAF